MSDFKSFIGQKVGPFVKEVSQGQFERFYQAVSARVSVQAPPTILTICRDGEFAVFEKMGVPLSRVLHAEQEYEYENPVREGDKLTFGTTVTNVLSKKGTKGEIHFMTLQTDVFRDTDGSMEKVAAARTTVVVR